MDNLKQGSKVFFRAIIKGVTGFIIVPLGLMVNAVKEGWEESNLVVKIYTGVLLIPITAFLLLAAPWWQDFDIVD